MPKKLLMLALLLSACASDVRRTRLADVDFTDMASVQKLADSLDPDESAAFKTYVLLHLPTSAGFCGRKLVGPDGKEPATVGQAIQLTLARDAETRDAANRRAELLDQERQNPRRLISEKWKGLIAERDTIRDLQTIQTARRGSAAKRLPEWAAMEARLTEIDRELAKIKPFFVQNNP